MGGNFNRVRIAVQWLRTSDNFATANYDAVVFDLRLKQYGSVVQEPEVTTYQVMSYADYNAIDGKQTLTVADYIDFVIRDEAGLVTWEAPYDYEHTSS